MFGEFIAALLIGLALALVFAYGFGRTGPWGGFVWFFLVVFLGAWAIGLWVEPVGPPLWGVAWVPILIGALLIALLIAAIPPAEPAPRRAAATDPVADVETAAAASAIGLFFWVLLMALVLVILLSFLF